MRFIFMLIFLMIVPEAFSQSDNIVWDRSVRKVGVQDYVIDFTATLAPGWHLYSQHLHGAGPIPTRFQFDKKDGYVLIGMPEEYGKATMFHDDLYDKEITWYSGSVRFHQKLKVNIAGAVVEGAIDFMTCNEQVCMPQRYPFSIMIPSPGKMP